MMNSKVQVNAMVADWKSQGLPKTEIVVNTARAEVGWDYVWGATGQVCTPSQRNAFVKRQRAKGYDGEAKETINKCQVLNGKKANCEGCKWYCSGECTLIDDCQGFVKQVLNRVGISLSGGGCTSMWNNKANWTEQGKIANLPEKVCCVFWTDTKDKNKKSHIGFYIGNGRMIHCSGSVKEEALSKKCTDYALIKGLEGDVPVGFPTLRKGDKGEYVTLMQTKLVQLGYSLDPYGADGKFGNKTFEALKAFQTDKGLNPDGVCGQATWDALMSGEIELYTVTIPHLSKSIAEELVNKYGGSMVKEGASA